MENLALKDEQIARQAEEIESLNRKVESLEKELSKCLDPDSGEINPSIIHREKKQAEEFRTMPSDREFVLGKIEGLIKEVLGLPEVANYDQWVEFRHLLTIGSEVRHLRNDDSFLYGVSVMNKLIDRLIKMYDFTEEDQETRRDHDFGHPFPNDNFYFRYYQSTPKIVLGAVNASDEFSDYKLIETHKGFLQLKQAFNLLSVDAFGSPLNHAEMRLHLDVILWCQEYSLSIRGQKF